MSTGENIILTCTVELTHSLEIDVPLTVNVTMSDPNGRPIHFTTRYESSTSFTSTAKIYKLRMDQSGFFMCVAKYVSTSSSFLIDSDIRSSKIKVTVGKPVGLARI